MIIKQITAGCNASIHATMKPVLTALITVSPVPPVMRDFVY